MSVTVNEVNTNAEAATFIEKSVALNPSLQSMRREALEVFQQAGLPDKKAEEYKHTPIARLLQKNFNFDEISSLPSSLDPTEFMIPSVKGNVIVLINGIYSPTHSSIVSPAEEITVQNLSEVLSSADPEALAHFGKYADLKADSFTAWNTASWNHGVFIKVPDGATVGKPVLIYHVHDAVEGQVISATRNLFILGKNSKATIIEKYDSRGKSNHLSNTVTEVVVAERATLDAYTIQNDHGNRYHWGLTYIHQETASRVNTFTFTLGGSLIRNTLQLSLDGEGIESHMFGLYLITGDTLADNHTVVDHRKPNSYSNEIYKGIMDENAKGVFNGKIYVRPQAQKTNAFQANRNILLSDKATVNTKPQLEIWADDVKCSHGCTTGQLDEEAMFYLQTRGIHKETARAMMLYAFALEVLSNVKDTELKSYLDQLVSERLHKNF